MVALTADGKILGLLIMMVGGYRREISSRVDVNINFCVI